MLYFHEVRGGDKEITLLPLQNFLLHVNEAMKFDTIMSYLTHFKSIFHFYTS